MHTVQTVQCTCVCTDISITVTPHVQYMCVQYLLSYGSVSESEHEILVAVRIDFNLI